MRKSLLAVLTVALAGCGSSATSTPSPPSSPPAGGPPAPAAAAAPPAPGLSAAENPGAASFPSAGGTNLTALAKSARTVGQLGPATGTFTPGTDRVAFGVLTNSGEL